LKEKYYDSETNSIDSEGQEIKKNKTIKMRFKDLLLKYNRKMKQ